MSRCLSLLSLPFIFFGAAAAGAAEESETPQPWQWMLGSHTNYQHTLRDPESGATPVLDRIERMNNVAAEGTILLSQQAYLFASDEPLRRRIYQFVQRRGVWIQHIFDVASELSLAEVERPENWRPLRGCSIRWQQQEDHFTGANDQKDCYFFIDESGERVAVVSTIKLFQDYFVLNDRFEIADELPIVGIEHSIHSEYQRTTFYDAVVSYSALSNNQWESVNPTAQLHDQGARTGLVLQESGLELRYQIELQRILGELKLTLHDLSRGEVVYEKTFAADAEVVEYDSARLRVRLTPRP